MFPLQRSDDLVPLQIPSASMPGQQDQIQQDLISGRVSSMTTNFTINNKTQRRQRRLSNVEDNKDESEMDFKLKKIVHRDIERQRRQEMANLYASLRSLLPLEYVKGKRSISDHMYEAVNYIKHLQKNIKELHIRRDKLKFSNSGGENKSSNRDSLKCVTVNSCQDGVEILISTGSKEKNFPLSRVLRRLFEEGLHVVSCISTVEKESSLHIIQSEVGNMACIDLVALQQIVADMINQDFDSEQLLHQSLTK